MVACISNKKKWAHKFPTKKKKKSIETSIWCVRVFFLVNHNCYTFVCCEPVVFIYLFVFFFILSDLINFWSSWFIDTWNENSNRSNRQYGCCCLSWQLVITLCFIVTHRCLCACVLFALSLSLFLPSISFSLFFLMTFKRLSTAHPHFSNGNFLIFNMKFIDIN